MPSQKVSTFGSWAGQTSQVPLPPVASPTEQQSVVYDGTITAPATGSYQLGLSGWAGEGVVMCAQP